MKVLLLGGTHEARLLAPLIARSGHHITASLAGATTAPADYGVPTRVGGFGGVEGLRNWLERHQITCLIDATHPFARQMPFNAAAAATKAGIDRLRLLRPGWAQRPHWRNFDTLDEACQGLKPQDRVLVTTGREDLAPMQRRVATRFWVRSIDSPGDLPAHMTSIRARPPFSTESEEALMQTHRITHLLTKNSGGDPAKLDAADRAGVPVLMIRRPPQPTGPVVCDPNDVLDWLATLAPR